MSWYAKVLSNHPYIIIITVAVFSGACLVIPFTTKKIPSFTDPTLGFETRGTTISQRLRAWHNLAEATRPSGSLTVNPRELIPPSLEMKKKRKEKEDLSVSPTPIPSTSPVSSSYLPEGVTVTAVPATSSSKNKGKKKKKKGQDVYVTPSPTITLPDQLSEVDQQRNWTFGVNVSEAQPDYGNSSERWKSLLDQLGGNHPHEHDHDHDHLSKDGFFCGSPSSEYSHLVLSTTDGSDGLSLGALHSACGLEKRLKDNSHFKELCQTSRANTCCHSWSLHNYIAALYNHDACLQITQHDVESTRKLLVDCAQYYHNLKLPADCQDDPNPGCLAIPSHCTKYNAVYNILHYLVDVRFLPPNDTHSVFVTYSMLYLPMASSSSMMPYFKQLDFDDLEFGNMRVLAMDLGLKDTLFDDCLVRDTWLIGLGAFFVVLCMWWYTGSFFVTLMVIIAIGFSLGIAYFFYTVVLDYNFFPFMNLLACVVAVGIGADDAFIFCKVWNCVKGEKSNASLVQRLQETLNHSVLSMMTTSFTTTAAFFASLLSPITAVRCFSVFAGISVIANLVLMVSWLPAAVVISEHLSCPSVNWQAWNTRWRGFRSSTEYLRNVFDQTLGCLVVSLPYVWLVILGLLSLASAVVVLYQPGLQLPDSPDFQLFDKSHPFEKYDLIYRDQFRFERLAMHSSTNVKMPLRFVWGAKPVDVGDYMNPYSNGKLQLDASFDMASPESQQWLLNFCKTLRTQPFYQPTSGPLLPNCFIESLVTWMKQRCIDSIDKIDRSPCCEKSHFPYARYVLKNCTALAMESLYRTPRDLFDPGTAGPKFSKNFTHPRIRAVVVEYDSNFSYSMSHQDMHTFYTMVEKWVQGELEGAPPGMKHGWFISDLHFYDLQDTIAGSTISAITISIILCLAVVLLVTLNIFVSFFAIVSVSCTIFVTIAILILIGWELNVLESIAICTAIGLAIDFSLHYSVSYQLAPDNTSREEAVKFALQRMAGPTAMSALTTGFAGIFMLPSSVLAYIQIGMFLVILMTVSWIYSTFFLMSLLCVAGPRHGFGQFSYKTIFCCFFKKNIPGADGRSNKSNFGNILSESSMSASSTLFGLHASSSETHELDALSNTGRKSSRLMRRSGSLCSAMQPARQSQRAACDQSPSAASACTVILGDDVDLSRQHI